VRVVLAEDLFLLRDGLVRLLEAHGFEIVAAVDNGPSLLRELLAQRPDVAVVDVQLPPSFTDEGLQAALAARREVPGLPCWCCRSTSSSCTPGRPPSDDDNRRVRAVLAYLNR
jgi:DNA-binding NarL/FixJ family response regulator